MEGLDAIGVGVASRPSARHFKFQWQDEIPWRRICTLPITKYSAAGMLDEWVVCLAHEAVHAAGHVMNIMLLSDYKIGPYWSSNAEEAIAENGAVLIAMSYGITVDTKLISQVGYLDPDGPQADLHANMASRLAVLGFGELSGSWVGPRD